MTSEREYQEPNYQAWIAELIGTFLLVLIGTGSMILSAYYPLLINEIEISFAFGGIVFLAIWMFGAISGAHINPAVTIGFWISGFIEKREVGPYIFMQCMGALSASALLFTVFPLHSTLGGTDPSAGIIASFIIEVAITFGLMMVILVTSQERRLNLFLTALSIGLMVGLMCYIAGSYTGASMNPARSIGPAVYSRKMGDLWLYLIAPIIGASGAALLWSYIRSLKN